MLNKKKPIRQFFTILLTVILFTSIPQLTEKSSRLNQRTIMLSHSRSIIKIIIASYSIFTYRNVAMVKINLSPEISY